jgi:iron complex outermembrane receptor protein
VPSPGDIISYGPETLWIDKALYPNMYDLPCTSRFGRCKAPNKFYGANNSVPNTSNLDTYRASLTLNARNTEIGDITSITGYKKFKVFEYTDQDSSPAFLDDTRRKTTGWQFSQEIRTTADLTDRWNIIAGGFYLKTHYNHVQDFRINFAQVPFVTAADPDFPGAPVFQQNLQAQDQWSASMFAQTYYNITDDLKFQAGIRWAHEHTKMHASTITFLPADYANGVYIPEQYTFDCAAICGTNFGGPDVSGAKSWNDLGWKLGLDYKINPTTMIFASWARGFKSGGFAGRLGIAQDLGPYDPETVDTFEAGIKADMFDRHVRVNLTGFYTNYRDIQLAQIYFLNTTPPTQGNTILNAASAHIKGFELETTVMPFDGLTLNGSLGYLDAKFADFPFIDPFSISPANPTGIATNFKGHRLQNAPKYTAVLGASYEIPLGENKLQLNATYKYTSSKYLTAIDNANRSWIQPTHLVDANAEFFYQDRFSISLWGKNIFDKRYIQSVYDNFGYGALVSYQNPREYGVTLKANF